MSLQSLPLLLSLDPVTETDCGDCGHPHHKGRCEGTERSLVGGVWHLARCECDHSEVVFEGWAKGLPVDDEAGW